MSHPAGLPDLFIDRSLGRKKVPAILQGARLRLRTLAEVYGIPADQPVWSRRVRYSRNFGAVYSYWPFRVR